MAAANSNNPQILIYGIIGDDITSKDVADTINSMANPTQIDVRINSPGGDVNEATAIYNSLKRSKANVTVYVDALAASAASVCAMAGDTIIMPGNALMMIHNPLAISMGYASDLRKDADMLDTYKASIIASYQEKTGLNESDISDLMDAETWFGAQAACDMGFCDQIERQAEATIIMKGKTGIFNGLSFDLSKFKNLPKVSALAQSARSPKVQNKLSESEATQLTTADELKSKFPDVYNTVFNAGKAQAAAEAAGQADESAVKTKAAADERARLSALDEIAIPGYDELIKKAKYETFDTAEAIALKILALEKSKLSATATARVEDAAASGVNNIAGSTVGTVSLDKAKEQAVQNSLGNAFDNAVKQKTGGK